MAALVIAPHMLRNSTLKTYTPLKRTGFKRKPKRGRPRRAIDYSKLTLPKPVREIAGVREYPDGRIVFNRRHPVSGAHAYQCAVILMADRQGWLCSICGKAMLYEEVSFEHGNLARRRET
jgi:hypothetical protein